MSLAGKLATLDCLSCYIFILGSQIFPLHNSSLFALGNPVCFLVSAHQWLEPAPELLDLLARYSHPILALSMDLFRYWGRMMWDRIGVES